VEFRKRGLGNCRMEDLALSGLISKGTLYQYFTNKDEIYEELLWSYSQNLESFLKKHFEIRSEDLNLPKNRLEMRQFLTKFFANLCQFCADDTEAFKLFLGELFVRESRLHAGIRHLQNYVEEQKNRQIIRSQSNPETLSQMLFQIWRSLLLQWLTEDRPKLFGISHTDDFVNLSLDLLKIDS